MPLLRIAFRTEYRFLEDFKDIEVFIWKPDNEIDGSHAELHKSVFYFGSAEDDFARGLNIAKIEVECDKIYRAGIRLYDNMGRIFYGDFVANHIAVRDSDMVVNISV